MEQHHEKLHEEAGVSKAWPGGHYGPSKDFVWAMFAVPGSYKWDFLGKYFHLLDAI